MDSEAHMHPYAPAYMPPFLPFPYYENPGVGVDGRPGLAMVSINLFFFANLFRCMTNSNLNQTIKGNLLQVNHPNLLELKEPNHRLIETPNSTKIVDQERNNLKPLLLSPTKPNLRQLLLLLSNIMPLAILCMGTLLSLLQINTPTKLLNLSMQPIDTLI
jgi:hypothetical protein